MILSASTFTEEEEKIAVMIRFLSTLVHRKERKAGLFRSYVDFWKLGSICLWFASARTCVRACVRACVCVRMRVQLRVRMLSHFQLFGISWTVAYQTPLCIKFSRQAYWSGLSFPSLGDLPDPQMEPGSPALQADALPTEPPGKSVSVWITTIRVDGTAKKENIGIKEEARIGWGKGQIIREV